MHPKDATATPRTPLVAAVRRTAPTAAVRRAGPVVRRHAVSLLLPPLVLAILFCQLDVSAARGGPSWAATGAPLVTAAALPALGALADRHGRRRAVIGSLALLVAGTLLGAAARDAGPLLAARVVQGLGTGGATAGVVALFAERLPARERGPYLATLVGATVLALSTGRLADVTLATHLWVPWATVCLGALALAPAAALPRRFTTGPAATTAARPCCCSPSPPWSTSRPAPAPPPPRPWTARCSCSSAPSAG
ncbi:MFS transporter [Streptomyces sp. MNU76]|uniref:MFS transporter n=1 Tax=Streptomyces sp. MNU76 TaxID=2560026 RepID=UPI001E333091|nr:MFS transporter [Streptomyces sp. MNU76]MCC9711591.1 MFS transporter [Streptomyces sp. MNU76]